MAKDFKEWETIILETHEVSLRNAPNHCLESISRVWFREGEPRQSPRDNVRGKDRAESPGRPKQLEFTGQDIAQGTKCWRSSGSSSPVFHWTHISLRMGKNHQRERKESSESIRGNHAWSLHRANNGVCSHQPDLENLLIPRWSIHKGLAAESREW